MLDYIFMPELPVTYEVGFMQPMHPDPSITARMRECGMGTCGFGCKIYGDPKSNVRVLAHSSSYGCPIAVAA